MEEKLLNTMSQTSKRFFFADQAITQLPDYNQLGRLTRLRLNPKDIPDLGWDP